MDEYREYAPYFRNGRLYLTEKTVVMLTETGLNKELGRAALEGLALDDHRQQIAQISAAMEQMLEQLEEDTQVFQVLSSNETQFLLTGKPRVAV